MIKGPSWCLPSPPQAEGDPRYDSFPAGKAQGGPQVPPRSSVLVSPAAGGTALAQDLPHPGGFLPPVAAAKSTRSQTTDLEPLLSSLT